MLASANAVNARVAFFCSPRYRTLPNPQSCLTTPNTCSTRARMRDLLRFLLRVSSLMNGGVVNEDHSLLHHLLNVTQAQRVVEPFENFAQGAIDQPFTEIVHGPDCPRSLLRHNPGAGGRATGGAAESHLSIKVARTQRRWSGG